MPITQTIADLIGEEETVVGHQSEIVDQNSINNQASVDDQPDVEALMLYRDLGVEDAEMDLILQLAFISTMSLDGEPCSKLAAALEVLHPHHAGAFIIRGLRLQAEGKLAEAAEMFMIGAQSDLKALESMVLCIKMLEAHGIDEIPLAANLRRMIAEKQGKPLDG